MGGVLEGACGADVLPGANDDRDVRLPKTANPHCITTEVTVQARHNPSDNTCYDRLCNGTRIHAQETCFDNGMRALGYNLTTPDPERGATEALGRRLPKHHLPLQRR